jgi:hypothetical protein
MTADSVEYHADVPGMEPGQVLGQPGLGAAQTPPLPPSGSGGSGSGSGGSAGSSGGGSREGRR